jgi:hypothetical protein
MWKHLPDMLTLLHAGIAPEVVARAYDVPVESLQAHLSGQPVAGRSVATATEVPTLPPATRRPSASERYAARLAECGSAPQPRTPSVARKRRGSPPLSTPLQDTHRTEELAEIREAVKRGVADALSQLMRAEG